MLRYSFSLLVILISCTEFEVENELFPYFHDFENEAKMRGAKISYKSFEFKFKSGLLENNKMYALSQSTAKDKLILVDKGWFESASESERELILLHEFGHAFLCRSHLPGAQSLMGQPLPRNLWNSNRVELLDELFSRNDCN